MLTKSKAMHLSQDQMQIVVLAGLRAVNVLTASKAFGKDLDTCLDDDQMVALMACLRQELTLIQGPPGTGEWLRCLQAVYTCHKG